MDLPELAEAFKDHQRQGPQRHGQLMQRVQELMGQGIDVSSLFAHIVSTASTRDIPVKRAAYAFLSRYGSQNEELCILCINTLLQDCTDLDPVVRALALRTICSLGQKSVLRFMLQPLNSGLQDKNAHVRKTATMACISLYELDPLFVIESEIVDRLYGLLRDRETQVVVSSIMALETILVDEGGLVINQAIASYLLKRFKDWNSGQLQIILTVLCRYKPETDDEIYEIMNDIDDGLRHPSMAVQMATLKLFIWLCQDLDEIQDEVRNTIEETLLGQLESPVPEFVYGSLCHLGLLLEMNGRFLHGDLAHISALFCKPTDLVEIKLKKLELCAMIAIKTKTIAKSETVMKAILDHFCRMATMVDLASLQKQYPDRSILQSDRHALEAYVRVACRAIELMGLIGSQQQKNSSTEQQESRGGIDSSQEDSTIDSTMMMKICLHRLFRLLAVFSGLEYTYVTPSNPLDRHNHARAAVQGAKSSRTNRTNKEQGANMMACDTEWNQVRIADLDLEETVLAKIATRTMTAIEACWQRGFNEKKRLNEKSTPIIGTTGPSNSTTTNILDAHQVKLLGQVLLRHLDQEELDRIAKKKKPLRFRYDDPSQAEEEEEGDRESLGMSSSEPSDMSRLARTGGIRILLLEESMHQAMLRQQMEQVKAAFTTELSLETEDESNRDHEKRIRAISTALGMRVQYVLLLQQQIQDLVQSMDYPRIRAQKRFQAVAGVEQESTVTSVRIQAEQMATLHLACHLVAFSVEHESQDPAVDTTAAVTEGTASPPSTARTMPRDDNNDTRSYFQQRLAILHQAIDQLVIPEGGDSHGINRSNMGVSRDVSDAARFIESFYLEPLTLLAKDPSETVFPTTTGSGRMPGGIGASKEMDGIAFLKKGLGRVAKDKFLLQFGTQNRFCLGKKSDEEDSASEENEDGKDISTLLDIDWMFQVGFNTLAAIR